MRRFRNLTPAQLDELVRRYDYGLPTITSARVRRPVRYYEWRDIKVCDDSFGNWYVWGREYGPEYLVRAQGESGAIGIVYDELPAINSDDLPDAYNAFDKLIVHLVDKGHENTLQLRRFCSQWSDVFFKIATHDANATGAWDNWEIDEAYQYQDNSTGTGIVEVGHYEWIEEIDKWDVHLSGELE